MDDDPRRGEYKAIAAGGKLKEGDDDIRLIKLISKRKAAADLELDMKEKKILHE